jgi:hypothetical protein
MYGLLRPITLPDLFAVYLMTITSPYSNSHKFLHQ